jgi:hypothetical protein
MTKCNPEALGRVLGRAGAIVALSISVSACGMSQITAPFSGGGGLFGSGKTDESASKDGAGQQAGWGATVTEAGMLSAARDGTSTNSGDVTSSVGGCPSFEIASGDGNITMKTPGAAKVPGAANAADSMAVMHLGEITKTARECATNPKGVSVKYGFSGRVLLGPQGKTGNIMLPVKVTVIDGARKTVKSETLKVPVTVPADQTSAYFSMVREIVVPLPAGTSPQGYKVQVGFERTVPGAS